MRIIAGLGYDGRHPNTIEPVFNTLVCGEAGLLHALEFRLGIVTPHQSNAARIVAYHSALSAVDSPDRFYHQSFTANALVCAEALLAWRDYALDHGWKPLSGDESPGRLADLAAVEQWYAASTSNKTIAPCTVERTREISDRLARLETGIDCICLHHPAPDWPPAIQRLLVDLQNAGTTIDENNPPEHQGATPGTDLHTLQQALLDSLNGHDTSTIELANDGSVECLTANESQVAAQYTCQRAQTDSSLLVIATGQQFILNWAAIDAGFADPGLGERSRWRAPSQLLPLLLQCAWSPPDASIVLQYLTLAAGPLKSLRRRIARHFADQPGHNKAIWKQEAEDYLARLSEKDPEFDASSEQEKIDKWVTIGLANSTQAMPTSLAARLASQVSHYWAGQLIAISDEQHTAHISAALSAADALLEALQGWEHTSIEREQLNRLLDIAMETTASVFQRTRKVSQFNAIEGPECARLNHAGIDHLLWWDVCLEADKTPPPFTREEISALPDMPNEQERSAGRIQSLKRAVQPILQAQQKLTLVYLGESTDLLRLYFERLLPTSCWQPLETCLLNNTTHTIALKPIVGQPLPEPQRWWTIDQPVPFPKQRESYTSLSTLVRKPHEYCLQYTAKLREGAMVDVPVDARLKGNLAHRIIETWFDVHPWRGTASSPSDTEAWLATHLDEFITTIALPLAAPGQRVERMDFQGRMTHALQRLQYHLQQAGVQELAIEEQFGRAFGDAELTGFIDLIGTLCDGQRVIIDMKWANEKYRLEELKENLHLQLATYAHLAAVDADTKVAEVAYFILPTGNLLCGNNRVFPTAREALTDDVPLPATAVWDTFHSSIQWRAGQLQSGRVEVTYGSAEMTDESVPPDNNIDVLTAEDEWRKKSANTWGQTSKRIDIWRAITGETGD